MLTLLKLTLGGNQRGMLQHTLKLHTHTCMLKRTQTSGNKGGKTSEKAQMIQIYYSAKKKQTDKAIVPRQVSGGGSKHRRSVRQRGRWSTMSHPL